MGTLCYKTLSHGREKLVVVGSGLHDIEAVRLILVALCQDLLGAELVHLLIRVAYKLELLSGVPECRRS